MYLAVVIFNAQFYSRFSGPNFAQIFEEIVVHLLFLAVKHQFLQCELNFAQNYDQNSEQKSTLNIDHKESRI